MKGNRVSSSEHWTWLFGVLSPAGPLWPSFSKAQRSSPSSVVCAESMKKSNDSGLKRQGRSLPRYSWWALKSGQMMQPEWPGSRYSETKAIEVGHLNESFEEDTRE